jgi:chromosome segregation ATPase
MPPPPVTPPRDLPLLEFVSVNPQTPGPVRARVHNLQNQVSQLVRDRQGLERKQKSELSEWQSRVEGLNDRVRVAEDEARRLRMIEIAIEKELERCKAEGEGMRDEVRWHNPISDTDHAS